MRTDSIIASALIVLNAFTSCSEDTTVEPRNSSNEISYKVSSAGVTRTIDGYYYGTTNGKNPQDFYVYCNNDEGNVYFPRQHVEYVNGSNGAAGGYSSTNGKHYWPEGNHKLDFYAYSNFNDANDNSIVPSVEVTQSTRATTLTFANVAVDTNSYKQKDILYALSANQAQPADKGSVGITFQHALAQLAFKIKSTSNYLFVLSDGITLYNVKCEGDAKIVSSVDGSSLSAKMDWTTKGDLYTEYYDLNQGGYATNCTMAYNYTYTVASTGSSGVVAVYGRATPIEEAADNTTGGLMVIPQTPDNLWDGAIPTKSDGTQDLSSVKKNKTYVGLRCRIWRLNEYTKVGETTFDIEKVGTTSYSKNDVIDTLEKKLRDELGGTLLVGEKNEYGGDRTGFKELMIPLPTSVNWESNKKYTYTINVGSKDTTIDDDGTNVFASIDVSFDVEAFTNSGLVDVPVLPKQ